MNSRIMNFVEKLLIGVGEVKNAQSYVILAIIVTGLFVTVLKHNSETRQIPPPAVSCIDSFMEKLNLVGMLLFGNVILSVLGGRRCLLVRVAANTICVLITALLYGIFVPQVAVAGFVLAGVVLGSAVVYSVSQVMDWIASE